MYNQNSRNRLIELDPNTIQLVRSNYLISSVEQLLEELLLNCIDAKATKIRISLVVHSLSQVDLEVSDNGHGIDYEGMKLLGKRNVTGKVDAEGDLNLFGYRGEALYSIVNLTRQVSVTSRTSLSEATCSKQLSPKSVDNKVEITFLSHQNVGTTIKCVDVYSSQPVRKNILLQSFEDKSKTATTLNSLKKIIQNIALVHPQLDWNFQYNNSNILIISSQISSDHSTETLTTQFANVIGTNNCLNMVPIKKYRSENCTISIEGIGTNPIQISSYSRSKNFQFVYMNRRLVSVEHDWIRKTVNQEYKKYLLRFRDYVIEANPDSGTNFSFLQPNFLLLIDTYGENGIKSRAAMARASDISAALKTTLETLFNEYHPLKERGLSSESFEFDLVLDSDENICPIGDIKTREAQSMYQVKPPPKKRKTNPPPPKKSLGELLKQTKQEYVTYGKIAEDLVKTQRDGCFHIERGLVPHSTPLVSADSEDIRITRSMIKSMQVLSQLDKKFIVVKLEKDNLKCICLIDQHAADERIRLEMLESETIQQTMTSDSISGSSPGKMIKKVIFEQAVIVAEAESDPKLIQQIIDFEQALNKWYWKIDICGGSEDMIPGKQYETALLQITRRKTDKRVALLKTCPSVLGEKLSIDDLKDYLNMLSEFESPSIVPPGVYRILNYKACRSAVMFGDYLEKMECENIVQMLSKCRLPFQCAHGRPSMTILFKYA